MEVLDLSHNRMWTLPWASILCMTRLLELRLAANPISSVSGSLAQVARPARPIRCGDSPAGLLVACARASLRRVACCGCPGAERRPWRQVTTLERIDLSDSALPMVAPGPASEPLAFLRPLQAARAAH